MTRVVRFRQTGALIAHPPSVPTTGPFTFTSTTYCTAGVPKMCLLYHPQHSPRSSVNTAVTLVLRSRIAYDEEDDALFPMATPDLDLLSMNVNFLIIDPYLYAERRTIVRRKKSRTLQHALWVSVAPWRPPPRWLVRRRYYVATTFILSCRTRRGGRVLIMIYSSLES